MSFSDYYSTGLRDCFSDYYSFISDGITKYGKPVLLYCKAKAIEYPIPALVVSNLALIYLAKKTAAAVSLSLNKLSRGGIPCKWTAPLCGYSVVVVGNYALYKCLELNQPLHIIVGVPALTFAFVVVLHSYLYPRNPASKLAVKERKVERPSKVSQENEALKEKIIQNTSNLMPPQVEILTTQFSWWDPNDVQSLNLKPVSKLSALLQRIEEVKVVP